MRLNALIERKRQMGLTNAQLSAKTGIPMSTLDKLTSGINSNPTLDTLQRLSDALNLSLDDFSDNPRRSPAANNLAAQYDALDEYGRMALDAVLGAELERIRHMQSPAQATQIIRLPRYDSPAAAGAPLDAQSDRVMTDYPALAVPPGTSYAVGISGQSMQPLIPDGSTAFVRQTTYASDGDVVIAWLPGEGAVCKRMAMKGRSLVRLMSVNPAFPHIEGAALSGAKVLGQVLGIMSPDGTSRLIPVSASHAPVDADKPAPRVEDNIPIGETIHNARLSIGASQRDIALAIGARVSSIRAWEEGKQSVPPEYREPLARALKIPIETLVP